MATIPVKNAAGATVDVELPNANGRAAANSSRPVALSNEDKAALDGLAARLDSAITLLTQLGGNTDTLETILAATNALLTTQGGQTDGLETLIGATNTLLTAQAGYVDGLEALVGTTNTLLTTQAGYVDGLEALIGTTNTTLAALNGYVDGLEALAAASLPAGANLIGKVGIDQTTDGTTNKVNVDASLKSSTPTRTVVPSGVASGVILAANAARKGAVIYNSDANALLLDLSGGAAAANRCQVRLAQYQTYTVDAGYTGLITGIWEGDGAGQADVVEFT